MCYSNKDRDQKYNKAKEDLLKAYKSCSELYDYEKMTLLKELMEDEAIVAFYTQIQNMFQHKPL